MEASTRLCTPSRALSTSEVKCQNFWRCPYHLSALRGRNRIYSPSTTACMSLPRDSETVLFGASSKARTLFTNSSLQIRGDAFLKNCRTARRRRANGAFLRASRCRPGHTAPSSGPVKGQTCMFKHYCSYFLDSHLRKTAS